jgi:hypothetical protein
MKNPPSRHAKCHEKPARKNLPGKTRLAATKSRLQHRPLYMLVFLLANMLARVQGAGVRPYKVLLTCKRTLYSGLRLCHCVTMNLARRTPEPVQPSFGEMLRVLLVIPARMVSTALRPVTRVTAVVTLPGLRFNGASVGSVITGVQSMSDNRQDTQRSWGWHSAAMA